MNRTAWMSCLVVFGAMIGCGGGETEEQAPTTNADESGSEGGTGDGSEGGTSTGAGEEASGGSEGADSSGDGSTGDGSDTGDFPPWEGLLDCGPEFPVNEDPRCNSSADKGQVGAGPIFVLDGATGMEIAGGALDPTTAELYVIVTGLTDDTGLLGELSDSSALFAVDLETGDRRLASGLSIDVANGNAIVGAGPLFEETSALQIGADGTIYVNGTAGLFTVDRTTGDRTLVRDWELDDTGADPCLYIADLGPDGSFVMSPDGQQFWFAWASFAGQFGTSRGVMLYDRATDQCTVSSSSGDHVVAMGPAYTDVPSGMTWAGDKILATTFMGEALFEIDPATGQRRIVSKSGDPQVGGGDDCLMSDYVAVDDDAGLVYVTGESGCSGVFLNMTAIDPATGERTLSDPNNGPLGGANVTAVWSHPFWPVVLMVYWDGIVMFDPANGNNVFLSR